MFRFVALVVALTGMLAALLALTGCGSNAPAVSLPLSTDRPTLLFLYTDG